MSSLRGRGAAPAAVTQLPTCDRLWTFQDVSAFLGVPIGTLHQWRTAVDNAWSARAPPVPHEGDAGR